MAKVNGNLDAARHAAEVAQARLQDVLKQDAARAEAKAAADAALAALGDAEARERAQTREAARVALTHELRTLGTKLVAAAETVCELEAAYIGTIERMKRCGIVTGPQIRDAFGVDYAASIVSAARHLRQLQGNGKRALPPSKPRPSAAELSRRFTERLRSQNGMAYGAVRPGGSTIVRVGGVDPDRAVITYDDAKRG